MFFFSLRFKNTNKNTRHHAFLFFFLSFFLSQVSLHLWLLTWHLVCFLFWCSKLQNHMIGSFFLSFFLFHLIFFFLCKKTQRSHVPFFLSSFLSFFLSFLNIMCTYTQMFIRLGRRILRLLLCRGVRSPDECPGYDTKQIILELCGMRSTPLLQSLPYPLWPGDVAAERILSMSQIELKCVVMLNLIPWNRSALAFKVRIYANLNLFD